MYQFTESSEFSFLFDLVCECVHGFLFLFFVFPLGREDEDEDEDELCCVLLILVCATAKKLMAVGKFASSFLLVALIYLHFVFVAAFPLFRSLTKMSFWLRFPLSLPPSSYLHSISLSSFDSPQAS